MYLRYKQTGMEGDKGVNSVKKYMPGYRFRIMTGEDQIAGLPAQEICFQKVSGIEVTLETEEIFEGGKNDSPHILCAPHKRHQPLVLERGMVSSDSWLHRLKPGMRLGTWLKVILLDGKGEMTGRQFEITDGIVTKWEVSGLNAMDGSVLLEKLEIMHDGITYH